MPESRQLRRPLYPLRTVPAWCGMHWSEHLDQWGCWSLACGWVNEREDCVGCPQVKEELSMPNKPELDALWKDVGNVLNGLAKVTYQDMVDRGFHDDDIVKVNTPTVLAIARCGLVGTEVAEMIEEARTGRPLDVIRYESPDGVASFTQEGECQKPTGFPIEMADVMIRLFDMAGCYGIDLGRAVRLKSEYNRSRPYKHGKVA